MTKAIPDTIAAIAHGKDDLTSQAGPPSRDNTAMLMAAAANPAGHINIGQVSPTLKPSDFQRK